jgi:hypothetical protein
MKRAMAAMAVVFGLVLATPAASAPFTPGNLLVVHDNTLFEFTLAGALLQQIPIVHPRLSYFDAGDVVVDRFGRAHIFISASSDPVLGTFDPYSGAWSHVPLVGGLGVLSDGDVGLLGDTVVRRTVTFDLLNGLVRRFYVPGEDISEVSVGLDGRLYVVNSGSPQGRVRIVDPNGFAIVGQRVLRDSAARELATEGITADASGTMYAVNAAGRIFEFAASGALLREFPTNGSFLVDINLSPDGTLVAGTFTGGVLVTDTSLSGFHAFPVPGSTRYAYAGRVPASIQRPDADADGFLDFVDTCPDLASPDQVDTDGDGLGDLCDPFPETAANLPVCLDRLAGDEASIAALIVANEGLADGIAALDAANAALDAEIEVLRAAIDTDQDGVPDLRDRCPNTPRWLRPGPNGCARRWMFPR